MIKWKKNIRREVVYNAMFTKKVFINTINLVIIN